MAAGKVLNVVGLTQGKIKREAVVLRLGVYKMRLRGVLVGLGDDSLVAEDFVTTASTVLCFGSK